MPVVEAKIYLLQNVELEFQEFQFASILGDRGNLENTG